MTIVSNNPTEVGLLDPIRPKYDFTASTCQQLDQIFRSQNPDAWRFTAELIFDRFYSTTSRSTPESFSPTAFPICYIDRNPYYFTWQGRRPRCSSLTSKAGSSSGVITVETSLQFKRNDSSPSSLKKRFFFPLFWI